MSDPTDGPVFTPAITYRDPKAALDWLERAFGFEVSMAIEGDDASTSHYEMDLDGRGRIMVGGEWAESTRSPAGLGGACTQHLHAQLTGDVDEHCRRAREAGATILAEPEDQFYGDRAYRAADHEGHLWTFGARVREVSRADAEAAIGVPITAPGWA